MTTSAAPGAARAADDSGTSPTQGRSGTIGDGLRSAEFLFVAAVFSILSLLVFWPAASHLGTRIIGLGGDGDNLLTVWQLWWFRHAVSTGQDPAFTRNVFALTGAPVPFFLENFFTEAAAVPLQSFLSPLASYNVLVISSFALGGTTAYALASEIAPNRLARFAAAFIYAFSTYHFFRAAGHLGEVTMEWMPFFAWRMLRFIRAATLRNAFLAAIGLTLVPLSEVYYGAYFALPFSLVLVAYLCIGKRQWFTLKTTGLLAGIYALAGVLTYVPLRSFLQLDASTQAVTASYASSSIVPLSADLAAFVLPDSYNPLFGKFTAPAYALMVNSFPIEQAVYLGLTALAASVVAVAFAARRRAPRNTWLWVAVSCIGALLALGPSLHILGRQWIPLPFYNALYGHAALASFRAPNRLVVLPLLGTAMLAGIGVNALLERIARPRAATRFAVTAVILAAVMSENFLFSMPYPAAAVSVPPIYATIGRDPADTILLDLPILPSGYFQMLQIFHGKRLVNGYTSRMTPEMENSVLGVPGVPFFVPSFETGINLAGPRLYNDVPDVHFRQAATSRNIHYVVFHKIVDRDSEVWAEAFLRKSLGAPMDDEPTLTVWHF